MRSHRGQWKKGGSIIVAVGKDLGNEPLYQIVAVLLEGLVDGLCETFCVHLIEQKNFRTPLFLRCVVQRKWKNGCLG